MESADKMDEDTKGNDVEETASIIENDGNGDSSQCKGGSSSTPPFHVTLGLRLEAKDFNGLWYPAKVMDIDEEKQVSKMIITRPGLDLVAGAYSLCQFQLGLLLRHCIREISCHCTIGSE